jgi:hypothetical protein
MIEDFAQRVIERAQRNLGATRTINGKKVRRVSSGTLKDSLTFTINYKARSTEILFGASGKAKYYGDIIEEGRKPNSKMPPIGPIMDWMKQKPVRLRGPKGGFVKTTPEGLRSAAFAIAKAIGKRGIVGIHFMKDAIEEELLAAGEDFTNQLVKDLQIKIDTIVWQ